jgi:serine/threonine protein kinase
MKNRVLVAAENLHEAEEIAFNLCGSGYEVSVVGTDDDAWSALQEPNAPRALVLDAALGGIGSLELCRRVRDLRGDDTYVLIITSAKSRIDYIEALEAGADGAIESPLDLSELRTRLAAGLRGRRVALSDAPAPSSPLSARDPADESLAGRVVARKYQIERLIGKGAMGTVWKGIHLSLGMSVAIKFIKGDYARHSTALARFELEARAAARLRTKYAVKVFDYGVTSGGLSYLVMEYLEGPSLLQRVQSSGALSFADTVTLVAQAGQALQEAHGLGIIHRDVKPDNLLLVTDPDAEKGARGLVTKLIDFGVVKMLPMEGSAPAAMPTAGGLVVGTPNFMAPEQLECATEPNSATDLWALAACAFTAITGRIPFGGGTMGEVLRAVCESPLPVPSKVNPAVPPEFDAWFARACHRNPAARFRSARELASTLAAAHTDYADATLDLSPSLTSFVNSMPTVARLVPRRVFELDEPMCVTIG